MKKILSYLLVVLVTIPITLAVGFYGLSSRSSLKGYGQEAPSAEVEAHLRSLQGKVAVITGASGGIGVALAKEAARHGMKLVLTDVKIKNAESLAKELGAKGTEAIVVQADLARDEDRAKIIATAKERYGGVDALFNNAGYSYLARAEDMAISDVRKSYEVNLFAGMDLARLAVPVMKARGGGTIVNVSSILGHHPAVSGLGQQGINGVYSSTKAAMNAWSEVLREELSPHNITIKVVSPAGVKTGFWENTQGPSRQAALDESRRMWQLYDEPETIAEQTFRGLAGRNLYLFPGNARNLMTILETNRAQTFENAKPSKK